jgi:ferredoxin-NADP reductase/truncated hemoglobin YjbI
MSDYSIIYNKKTLSCKSNESLLDAFLRQGINISFSCKKGSCHSCLMQCLSGKLPENAQKGLKKTDIDKGYFLPCSCQPQSNMEITEIHTSSRFHSAVIHQKDFLSDDICRLSIEPGNTFDYHPGQYINIRQPKSSSCRSYSLVSHPDDYFIELHIKNMYNGELSGWIHNELKPGDEIEIQGPAGDCYYAQASNLESPLLLVARGTGMAPLYGIVLDAIRHGHRGSINVFHDGSSLSDMYLHNEFIELTDKHENINYTACVDGLDEAYVSPDNALDLLYTILDDFNDPTVFVAGAPQFVLSINALIKHHNIDQKKCFSDNFNYKDLRNNSSPAEVGRRRSDVFNENTITEAIYKPQPDNEMWLALDKGKKLKVILDDFYSQVYQDDRLSGFFDKSTQQRSSEKQYLFMRQLFSGEKIYFGDRPKNAHHWMVISNELFDYREKLLAECLRQHGIAEHLIQRWMDIDENFRPDIVKQQAIPKVVNGIEMPLDGYEILILDEGTLCDGCQQAIDRGESVRYHLRTGQAYCNNCMQSGIAKQAV